MSAVRRAPHSGRVADTETLHQREDQRDAADLEVSLRPPVDHRRVFGAGDDGHAAEFGGRVEAGDRVAVGEVSE